MGGVTPGQAVSAAVTNGAFLEKNGDDTAYGKISLADSDGSGVSGTAVTNVQRELNAIWSFLGGLINQAKTYKPSWTTPNFGGASDDIKTKVAAIDAAFSTAGSQAARAGNVSIGNGNNSVAVSFSSPMPDDTYIPDFTFQNLVDSTPIFLQGMITAKTASGFTVSFNAATDSANYSLNYKVRKAA